MGDDQPHLNLVDTEFFLELRYDAVQQGRTGLAELLDELVCSAYFIKVALRVEVARIGDDDVGKVLADVSLELVGRCIANLHGESEGRLVQTLEHSERESMISGATTDRVLVQELCHDGVQDVAWEGLALVDEGDEDVCDKQLYLFREVASDEAKKVAKDFGHELVGVGEVAHEHDALDGGEGLEEVKVLVVVGGIGALEAGGELPEEELEDVLELVLGIRGVGCV